jgi:hypothetical protein
LILRSPGYTRKKTQHEKELKQLGEGMRQLIKKKHGKSYANIAAVDLYPTTGAASDWFYDDEVYEEFGHRVYGYTIELRPEGNRGATGFILPPSEIVPTGEEILEAFLYFSEQVVKNPL